jgi:deoxyribodipyrimidine photolyase-related protein
MPLDTKIPKIKTQSDNDLYFINKHKKHVNSLYKDNIGSTEDSWFAVTHDSAKKVVSQFLRRKLVHFGDYQDFIMKENPILFHSSLSIVLNIGLITPEYVIK